MAKNASKSRLLSKFKKASRGTWKKNRDKKPSAKGAVLPGGLVRAVAKFSGYDIAEDKNGTLYFKLVGEVVEPEEFAGMNANVFHRMKETQTKTVQDKIQAFQDDLKLLGADLAEIDEDQIETVLEDLKDEGRHFFFNTWQPEADARNPNPSTFVFIQGPADEWDDSDDGPVVVDDDDDDEKAPWDEDDEEDDADDLEDDSQDDAEDDTDVDEDDADDDLDDDDDDDDGGDDWEPVKGDVYRFKASARSSLDECEVMTVNKGKSTCKLKRTKDGKTFPNVPWDKLEE